MLPLDIAFEDIYNRNGILTLINTITTYIFILDIVTSFITSYVNISTGDEIFGIKMIAYNYILNGTFFLDLVSTIQLDHIASIFKARDSIVKGFKIFGIIKIQRLGRI